MRFHASQVCASAAGDYYQLFLGPEESEEDDADPINVRGPYLMVQRQFEMFNGGRCYIESLDDNYVGEFPLKLTDLSPTCLAFEIVRTNNNHVHVSLALDASTFGEVRRIAEIIFGVKEPDDDAV